MEERSKRNTSKALPETVCQFNLSDLVRVDFVFPYGRVAVSDNGLMPEPFDRDARFSTNPQEIREIRDRIIDLFKKRNANAFSDS